MGVSLSLNSFRQTTFACLYTGRTWSVFSNGISQYFLPHAKCRYPESEAHLSFDSASRAQDVIVRNKQPFWLMSKVLCVDEDITQAASLHPAQTMHSKKAILALPVMLHHWRGKGLRRHYLNHKHMNACVSSREHIINIINKSCQNM